MGFASRVFVLLVCPSFSCSFPVPSFLVLRLFSSFIRNYKLSSFNNSTINAYTSPSSPPTNLPVPSFISSLPFSISSHILLYKLLNTISSSYLTITPATSPYPKQTLQKTPLTHRLYTCKFVIVLYPVEEEPWSLELLWLHKCLERWR